jgi:hypothetical protein
MLISSKEGVNGFRGHFPYLIGAVVVVIVTSLIYNYLCNLCISPLKLFVLYDIMHGPCSLNLGLFCFCKFINNVITPPSTILLVEEIGVPGENHELSNSNLNYSTKLIIYSFLKFGALVVIERVHAKYCKLTV